MKNSPEQSESVNRCGAKTEGPALSEVEGLGRLLGVIAHEIKNPLSTIKVNLRLVDEELQTGPAGDIEQRLARARRKLAVIDKEASRLEQILDSFLRYADRTQPRLLAADLNPVIDDIIDFYLPQAAVHSIALRKSLHKEPLICLIDAGMLKQAVLNLLINAQQAIGGEGEVMVQTASDGQYAQIQISDTGKGIPAERLSHLFEPYQSSRPDGTGLGLATVKKIIDAHKGTITVVSEPGKGTAFTIKLLLASSEDKR
ncbi:MAG: ATP-binding protein [Sedimentisphaerales bacterium]|jgi:signal transduction histidine kinase